MFHSSLKWKISAQILIFSRNSYKERRTNIGLSQMKVASLQPTSFPTAKKVWCWSLHPATCGGFEEFIWAALELRISKLLRYGAFFFWNDLSALRIRNFPICSVGVATIHDRPALVGTIHCIKPPHARRRHSLAFKTCIRSQRYTKTGKGSLT